jgi:hypothetical protein
MSVAERNWLGFLYPVILCKNGLHRQAMQRAFSEESENRRNSVYQVLEQHDHKIAQQGA